MEIRQILRDQRLELDEKFKATRVVEREFTPSAREFLKSGLVKAISGVRRCGKSFFTYLLLRPLNFGYANFDEKILLNAGHADIISSLLEIRGKMDAIFLDEIQNMDGWELFVNSLHRSLSNK